jgi:hypothetical protein
VSKGAFHRVPTRAGTGSARYEDPIYEVIEAGTTAVSQPEYNTTIAAVTTDGSATRKAHDSFTRVASVEAVADHRISAPISSSPGRPCSRRARAKRYPLCRAAA